MSRPLDPGPPPRKRRSFCRLCFCTCLALCGLLLVLGIYQIGKTFFIRSQFSHSRLFHNQTLDEVEYRMAVVRPLVDEKQLFDIAVSIWAPSRNGGSNNGSETALFSDIVFRGLRLSDKHKSVNLTYRLPTAVFRRSQLKEDDLRASFVLIPTEPSLVNHMIRFSTWWPQTAPRPPVRSWPFPLGAADSGPQSKADRALDSFGFSMPLLEFHEFGSKCTKSPILETPSADEDAFSDGADDGYKEQNQTEKDTAGVSGTSKYPEHALTHPFIVTRTQIQAVDETHIFNFTLYDIEHNRLRGYSSFLCGDKGQQPNSTLCDRTYAKNGNWETCLLLSVPNNETRHRDLEWAYAPYIDYTASAAGPKGSYSSPHPEYIDINWQLSYSGRSPGEHLNSKLLQGRPSRPLSYAGSDYKKAIAHDKEEMLNGLAGHRFYEDAHPRRRFILIMLLDFILSPASRLLGIAYWATRTSTVSISMSGTIFLALHRILWVLTYAANAFETQKPIPSAEQWLVWLWLNACAVATTSSLAFLMLKTVTRLTFSRKKARWIPTVGRAQPTHMERTSQRLDSRTSWRIKVGMCVSLIAINYISSKYHSFDPLGYHVLAPHHPPLGPLDGTSNPFARIYDLVSSPLLITAYLSQLLLNQRSKAFAGRYKITVVADCSYAVLHLIKFIPSVIGRFDARPGLSVDDIVHDVLLAALAWQAIVFPKVIQTTEEDSE
ncbi:hypothetical protein MSAN_01920400 [Mycena sanguinolenta]|uniref:Uncharacterized protein n=1 Tax=Mycena sanguinolenta TaxID=230812 RepID=A0A8H6XPZ2_9AGAR|nr:hypothetical protein MSAN_01920400 [Mycena sanguinolenta]